MRALGGGTGAGPGFAGFSGVHSHMTNTRETDVESLENRFPLRIEEIGLRTQSSGNGFYPGGEGLRRRYLFTSPVEVSLVTERRGQSGALGEMGVLEAAISVGASGMFGRMPGGLGRNTRIRVDGNRLDLGGRAGYLAEAGESLIIETPGGGGWGNIHVSQVVASQKIG